MLGDVPRQRHCEVEPERKARIGALLARPGGLDEVDLALGLSSRFGQEDVCQLDRRSFDGYETEALVDAANGVDHGLECELLGRHQLEHARHRARFHHVV